MYELPILPPPDETDVKSPDVNDVMENALFPDIPGEVPFICQPMVRILMIFMVVLWEPALVLLDILGLERLVGVFHFGMAFFVLFTELYAMYFYVKERQFKQFLYPVFLLVPEIYFFKYLAENIYARY